MTKNHFYITTTLPYVNAPPHIGFALEIVQADVWARGARLSGKEVVFNFGTDEHGLKIYRKARDEGKNPQEYADEYAAKFESLKEALNLSYTNFIRTTDPHHITAAQEFWRRCARNGDIYKKIYKSKYCVGCELDKTDSELVEGRCSIHPNMELETIEEENYFFRFSKYQQPLLDFYAAHADFVIPESKFKEIKKFVENGLEDFSISRLKTKMPWGIEIPDDPEQVMYVWFDALINYISTLGWPENPEWEKWWPGLQVAGKDNLRQQAAIWQAMLLSAGLPNSIRIIIHGFVTAEGKKISKSLGNMINPVELAELYGTDPVRYFLLAKLHPFEDSDFSKQKLEEAYNYDLANGLGNLVSRIARLAEKAEVRGGERPSYENEAEKEEKEDYRLDERIKGIWEKISQIDQQIEEQKPWTREGKDLAAVIEPWCQAVREIATDLLPILPQTAMQILDQYTATYIVSCPPLFPRLVNHD